MAEKGLDDKAIAGLDQAAKEALAEAKQKAAEIEALLAEVAALEKRLKTLDG